MNANKVAKWKSKCTFQHLFRSVESEYMNPTADIFNYKAIGILPSDAHSAAISMSIILCKGLSLCIYCYEIRPLSDLIGFHM